MPRAARLLLVLLAGAVAFPTVSSGAATARHCAAAPQGIERLRATTATCHAARLVARTWLKTSGPDGSCDTRAEDCTVYGYRCANTDQGFADTRVTCSRGARRVTFVASTS